MPQFLMDFIFFLQSSENLWLRVKNLEIKRSGRSLCVLLSGCHIGLLCSLDYKNSRCTLTSLGHVFLGYATFIAQMMLLQLEHNLKLCGDF